MKSIFKLSYIFLLLTFACARTPSLMVSRPWTRTQGQGQGINTNSNLYINVSGKEDQLPLKSSLTDITIRNKISAQLQRRGFNVTNTVSGADYIFNVKYQTKTFQRTQSEAKTFNSNYQEGGYGYGYGVRTALAIALQASSHKSSSKVETFSYTAYRHTLGFSITKNGSILWNGQSIWKNRNIDIRNKITSVTKILLSDLPGYGAVTPRVKALRSEKENNYYNIYIDNNSFTCPALPYLINFLKITNDRSENLRIKGISNLKILNAVVDLVQTTEYALPDDPNYKNPIANDQWAKVTLGGEYYIGHSRKKTFILIDLKGNKNGYNIVKAEKVDREKYQTFKDKLAKWENALYDYYHVFK